MVSMKLFFVLTLCVAAALAKKRHSGDGGSGGGGLGGDSKAPAARIYSNLESMKEMAMRAAMKVEKKDLELAALLQTVSEIAERSAFDVAANEEDIKSRAIFDEPKTLKERTFTKRLLLRLEVAKQITTKAAKFSAAKQVFDNLNDIKELATKSASDVKANDETAKSRSFLQVANLENGEANEENLKSRNSGANIENDKPKTRGGSDLDAIAQKH